MTENWTACHGRVSIQDAPAAKRRKKLRRARQPYFPCLKLSITLRITDPP
jgi:hypothetical protein